MGEAVTEQSMGVRLVRQTLGEVQATLRSVPKSTHSESGAAGEVRSDVRLVPSGPERETATFGEVQNKPKFQFYDDGSALGEADTLYQWWLEHEKDIETVQVKDSLLRNKAFWEQLTSDRDILQIVRTGYFPEFKHTPAPFFKRNNTTARNSPQFVLASVMDLLHNGFAKLTRQRPKVVNPFTVSVQGNGKQRLITDLTHLNSHIDTEKFKLEDLKAAMPALRRPRFLFSFDFKKAYFHTKILQFLLLLQRPNLLWLLYSGPFRSQYSATSIHEAAQASG